MLYFYMYMKVSFDVYILLLDEQPPSPYNFSIKGAYITQIKYCQNLSEEC